jgi:transposase
MSYINSIKEQAALGYKAGEIAKKLKLDIKTVKKYLAKEDFSPTPPLVTEIPSKLDPYKGIIDKWLEEDKENWYKQQHTAKRIMDRLREEQPGFDCAYSTVQRYVRIRRETSRTRANQELVWHPAEAQADFGEADFFIRGERVRMKYLILSFPYSNNGFVQVFGGETAECVCQGLRDIFAYIEKMPTVIVFDNATGVGRRVGEAIREAELFLKFRSHYGFSVRFCNPYSGHEKGNVERKVFYNRANLFVPPPEVEDIEAYNETLLDAHRKKASEIHYKKGVRISDLFLDDLEAMKPLPSKPFNVCRYEWVKTDGYGKFCLDAKHHYTSRPELSKQKILIGIRAHRVDVLESDGSILVSHIRAYADKRTDTKDHSTALAVLLRNLGAWQNSGVREFMPQPLRSVLDSQPKQELRESIRLLGDLTKDYGMENAMAAMEEALSRGRLNVSDTSILAARMAGYGLKTPPDSGPDLRAYDLAFLQDERGNLS